MPHFETLVTKYRRDTLRTAVSDKIPVTISLKNLGEMNLAAGTEFGNLGRWKNLWKTNSEVCESPSLAQFAVLNSCQLSQPSEVFG